MNDSIRLQFVLALFASGWFVGCDSPPTPERTDPNLSVRMPGQEEDGSGKVIDDPIKPPDLDPMTTEGGPPNSNSVTDANVTSDSDSLADQKPEPLGPELLENYQDWPTPAAVLFVTGQQNGYLEPCGCTGLDRQKGGMARRLTFLKSLQEKGWPLVPIDSGNQVRRYGRQAEIKLQFTAKALQIMDYQAVGFGPDDMRLGVGELLSVAAAEDPDGALYASANVVLIDPELMPKYKLIEQGGTKVGVTSVLDPKSLTAELSADIQLSPVAESAREVLAEMSKAGATFKVITFYGKEEAAEKLAVEVPGFDLMVVSGGYGEPTFMPETVEGSDTKLIYTGNKGMYTGLIGLYPEQEFKYARVALTHEFADAPEMRQLMADYQAQLRDVGLESLGLKPISHPSGRHYVGSARCGECHKSAYEVWESTPHFDATADIVKPPKERGDVARHFDPECISCHVTGWNPQNYYPYESGYLELQASAHLNGSGCENCHGPGAEHSAAEIPDSGVSEQRLAELREQMKLSYDDARDVCLECHDIDNSPDFHHDDAFENDYWPQVEHYGLD